MPAVSSSAALKASARKRTAATTAATAAAIRVIGQIAALIAVPNAATAGMAVREATETAAIATTITPNPTPIAVIAFVTAGC